MKYILHHMHVTCSAYLILDNVIIWQRFQWSIYVQLWQRSSVFGSAQTHDASVLASYRVY
jgi:hypothetical protein